MKMQLAQPNHQSTETMDQLRALNARFIHNFVTRDVPARAVVMGVSGRVVGEVSDQDLLERWQ